MTESKVARFSKPKKFPRLESSSSKLTLGVLVKPGSELQVILGSEEFWSRYHAKPQSFSIND